MYESLTEREIEIVRLMAAGLTNREIGGRLYIGVETVRSYAKQIYRKLDVHSREEASERAEQLGLLDDAQAERPAIEVNLPAQLTPFIGREREIGQILELLGGTRLLTLTGPGGSGKTRLSIEVSQRMAGATSQFSDGIHFVDLAPLTDPTQVPGAIANAVGVNERGDEAQLETLKRAIGERAMLLLIDNFEHVVEGAAVVPELLMAAPNLHILATSREALRLNGEQIYTVPPLRLPESDALENLVKVEAVTLFVQRAGAVRRGFMLNADNAADVAAICQRLDGMPLAIELAASQSRMLTPQAILKRMDERFRTLTGGARDAPARQRTLRATIDWSYNLLDEGEKTLFARLAVFRGGRSLEAVEAICGDDLAITAYDGLASLVDKSMVRQVVDRLGEPRFVMLETIQEYALERLEASGEAAAMRRQHAEYFADLTERGAPHLRQAEFEYWFKKFEIEHDNLRAALRWSLLGGGEAEIGLRIVGALRDFWFYEGYHIEGQRWAEQAFEHFDDAPATMCAGVLVTAGTLGYARQDLQGGKAYYGQALEIYRELGDEHGIAWGLQNLALASHGRPAEYDDAVERVEEALAKFRRLDDKPYQAQALNVLGNWQMELADYDSAWATYEACLALSQETGELRRVSMSQGNLGSIALHRGDYSQAEELVKASLALAWELDFRYLVAGELAKIAALAIKQGQAVRAARLLGAWAAAQDALGVVLQPQVQIELNPYLDEIRAQLDEAAWNEGRKMSLDEAVAYALGEFE